ncbi:sensor histidine kinase [Aquipuribacter nitratireducens]|uniref:histidine kinase n=1 Tax=Aquipuribacter nitratireducens TaxID=650104 RepID=A0ABW0GQQ5_9MICO
MLWQGTPEWLSRPRVGDAALVTAVGVATVVDVVRQATPPAALLAAAVGVVMAAGVLLRRRRPGGVLLAAAVVVAGVDAVSVGFTGLPRTFLSAVAVLVLVVAWGRWGTRRDAVTGAAGLVLLAVAGVWASAASPDEAVAGVAVLVGSALLGATVRYRATVREQAMDAARLQERELLARELHDSVAHAVTAIAVQAQAGLVLLEDDDADARRRLATGLRLVEREAARCLTDMRDLVATLRTVDGPTLARAVDAAAIRALAVPTATSGVPVVVDVEGDLDGFGEAQRWAAYRVVQEALTNTRRHARHATGVRVTVDAGRDELVVTVTDDGDPARLLAHPPGHGLVGMAERVRLLGGSLAAGPVGETGGAAGWRVEARLPRRSR